MPRFLFPVLKFKLRIGRWQRELPRHHNFNVVTLGAGGEPNIPGVNDRGAPCDSSSNDLPVELHFCLRFAFWNSAKSYVICILNASTLNGSSNIERSNYEDTRTSQFNGNPPIFRAR